MKKFIKFGVVGLINTLITIGCFTLLVHVGINYLAANIIAYVLGMINSFFWNKTWVFQIKSGDFTLILKFIIVNLITLGINTVCLYLFVTPLKLHPSFAQLFATGFGLVINFSLNKRWTFHQ